MKVWRVRAVEESDLRKFAAKLQSVLNRMEKDQLIYEVQKTNVEGLCYQEGKVLHKALVTGWSEAVSTPAPSNKEDSVTENS